MFVYQNVSFPDFPFFFLTFIICIPQTRCIKWPFFLNFFFRVCSGLILRLLILVAASFIFGKFRFSLTTSCLLLKETSSSLLVVSSVFLPSHTVFTIRFSAMSILDRRFLTNCSSLFFFASTSVDILSFAQ